MKTISELRIEGDARVNIHDMNKFEDAILGGRGDLDAWLECNNEEEVRLHIGKLLHLCVADLQFENQSLRAKIERMERQELGFRERCAPSSPTGYSNRFPLYAHPVAKGEEK